MEQNVEEKEDKELTYSENLDDLIVEVLERMGPYACVRCSRARLVAAGAVRGCGKCPHYVIGS